VIVVCEVFRIMDCAVCAVRLTSTGNSRLHYYNMRTKTDISNKPETIISTRYRPLWDVMIAGPPQCPVWCRLVTVPTDLFSTSTRPTGSFLFEWVKCQSRNSQNGGTVLPIANLMADSEFGSPCSYPIGPHIVAGQLTRW